MSTPRSIARHATLRVDHPSREFATAISLHAGSLGSEISPFVDLTEFEMAYPTFAPHPHAGFSAVTYLFEDSAGSFRNRWSKGGDALIGPGSLHWTQAGSGMLHEEIPTEPGVTCHGVQMFVRLAAADELTPPEAFHLDAHEIVELTPRPGVRIRVLAGRFDGVDAGIAIRNDLTFAEVHMAGGCTVSLPAPVGHGAFVFLQRGAVASGGTTIAGGDAAAFADDGGHVELTATADASFLFGAARPLGEPMHPRGSFIMSTVERLDEAMSAFRRGDMGHLDPSF